MGQSPCCGSSKAKEQRNAREEVLRSGGAARGRRLRAVRAAQRGAGTGAARARALARGAAAKLGRSCARAAVEGRRGSGGGGAAYGRV